MVSCENEENIWKTTAGKDADMKFYTDMSARW